MRCFVTGGDGFIGSHAARQMVAEGWEVAVLVSPGKPLLRIQDLHPRIIIVEAILADFGVIDSFLRAWVPDAALHCAWYAEPGVYLNSPKNVECLSESLKLLDLLIEAGCKSVVMAGTCAEYQTDGRPLTETSAVGPSTLYAAAKLAMGLVGERRAALAGVHFAWARIFYLFGPDEDGRRMIPALIRCLLSGREFPATIGEQARDYLYVEDVAAGLVSLLRNSAVGVYNISSGEPVVIRRLMEITEEMAGGSGLIRFGALPYRQWEPPVICGDSSRLQKLGWRPRRDLREALRLTIDYWRSQKGESSGS